MNVVPCRSKKGSLKEVVGECEYIKMICYFLYEAKQKYMCVSGFILRKNRKGRSDLIFILFFKFY